MHSIERIFTDLAVADTAVAPVVGSCGYTDHVETMDRRNELVVGKRSSGCDGCFYQTMTKPHHQGNHRRLPDITSGNSNAGTYPGCGGYPG